VRVYSRTDLLSLPMSIRAECGNWGGDALSMRCSTRMEEADVFFGKLWIQITVVSVVLLCRGT
jgi:hypothetical protein